jgi:lipoate---protein ligase
MSDQWRVIGPEKRRGALNLALEEACLESISRNEAPPTLFFYEWEKPAVIIGYFQKLHSEVNVEACGLAGIDIIRRISGGGAMYQDNDGGLTFGVIAPENALPKDINEAYRFVCGRVIDGLRAIGIKSEFKPINDIQVNGKKISGSAQTRRKNAVLVHGTLLYTLDAGKMFTFLTVGKEKISDKFIASVHDRVTSIKDQKDVTKGQIYDALIKAFASEKNFYRGQWTAEELSRAEKIVKERHENPDWVYMR